MTIRRMNLLIAAVVIAYTGKAIAQQPPDYIGIDSVQGTYFIDVPEGKINDFFNPDGFPNLVSAHRGGFKPMFPENCIETFNETIRFAPALLEVDLRRTSDGVWVLMHDDTLDRTTTGRGVVERKPWDEIKDLNLVDNDGTVTSFTVPTFQQALDWAENRAILELDLKAERFVSEVVDIVTANNAEDFVRFIADSVEQANTVYGQNPDIHLGLSFQPGNIDSLLDNIADDGDFPLTSVSSFSCCTGTVNPAEFNQQLHDNGVISIWAPFGIDGDLSRDDTIALYQSEFARGVDVMGGNRYMDSAVAAGFNPVPETSMLALLASGSLMLLRFVRSR